MNKPTSRGRPSDTSVTKSMRNRSIFVGLCFALVGFGLVTFNLVRYQIIDEDDYKTRAASQQLGDEAITPMRGTIYDANMKALAQSGTVWTVVANPYQMAGAGTNVNMVATKLAEILDLSVDSLLETLMDSKKTYKLLKRKVEKPIADEIEAWIAEYNATPAGKEAPIAGLELVEDAKRYYPYGSFASTVLGFTNVDGDGLTGLELYYNDILKGTEGRIVTARNARGYEMTTDYEAKYDAVDGYSLVLTIDETIQHTLEKYLGNAVVEHNVQNRAVGIVMNAKTGAIMAMSTMPDYDPNDPYTLYDTELAAQIAAIDDEELRTKERQTAQQLMWRNKAVQDIYEPGSVFKVVTSAIALDSGAADLHTSFSCSGSIEIVRGVRMRCAKATGHGTLDFTGGLDNSCNPYFIQLGWRIGAQTFCDYLQAFGFTERTGIDTQNEARSQTYSVDNMGITQLSSSSYGQSSTVTPIAMITAVAAAVNGGNLMQPYLVSQVLDANGNIVQTNDPIIKRQVISEETSIAVRNILAQSVASGHGNTAYVAGYNVGGKSGTSQKLSVTENNENDTLRIASFVGFAPADDPEIVVLVLLDEPNRDDGNSYGGRLCGPVVGSVIAEIMPYLGFEPQYTAEELAVANVTIPTVTEQPLSVAEERLNKVGLNYLVVGEGKTVTYQYPAAGTTIARQSTVVLYTEEGSEGSTVTVPNLVGRSRALASDMLKANGLNMNQQGVTNDGSGVQAVEQSIEAGAVVPAGTVVTVTFHDSSTTD